MPTSRDVRCLFMPMPDWLEPMAATLTQDRFSGPDWLFERKFDGIRLLAYKRGDDVRLYSRNRLPQNLPGVAAAIANAARRRAHSRRRDDVGRQERLSRLRHPLVERTRRYRAAARRTSRAAEPLPFDGADAARRARRRCGAVGSREARRLGRRDRQAPRIAVRASTLEALAEDEMRSCRRNSSSAASPIRRVRASVSARCSSATTTATTSSSPAKSAPASTRSSCWICASASTRSSCRQSPFTKAKGLPRLRATGCAPRSSCRSRSSSGRCTESSGIRGFSASEPTRTARCRRERRDHHPEKVLFPGRWDHQRRAGGVLRSHGAGDAAAPARPAGHDGAISCGHRNEGILAEGRLEGISGVARARRGEEEGRRRPSSDRHRHAVAAVDHQPEHHHASRLVVARSGSEASGRLRVRSRSVAGRSSLGSRGGDRPARSPRKSSRCRHGSRRRARRAFTSSSRSTAKRRWARSRGLPTPSARCS